MERSDELRDLVLAMFEAASRQDPSGIYRHTSSHEEVLMIGTDPNEWTQGRDAGQHHRVFPGRGRGLRRGHGRLDIESPGMDTGGWLADPRSLDRRLPSRRRRLEDGARARIGRSAQRGALRGIGSKWKKNSQPQSGTLWLTGLERSDVGLTLEYLAYAELSKVFLVLGKCRSDNRCAGFVGELGGEATNASVRPHDQDCVAFGDAKCVQGSKGGDRGQRGGAGAGGVDVLGLAGRHRLGDGYKLGPTSVVHRRAPPREEAEHLLAFREVSHI